MRLPIACLLFLLGTGCIKDGVLAPMTATRVHGRPIVAIVPVIDTSNTRLEWDVSEEMTTSILFRILQSDALYLASPRKVQAMTKKLKEENNPFGMGDMTWMKQHFGDSEYVAFMELVEHKEVLLNDKERPCDPKECSAELSLGMRVRVFDVRGDVPKVILQEFVTEAHFLPRPFTSLNFDQVSWGEETFTISPVGLAHTEFTKKVAQRIEDYVLLAHDR